MKGPSLPAPRHATVTAALASAAASRHGLIFVDRAENETFLGWTEIHRRSLRLAAALRALGIEPGDRVALVLPTAPSFVTVFFGVLQAGAVPVPLYPPVRLGRLDEYHDFTARMVQVAGARLVLTDGRIRRLLGKAMARARPALGCRTVKSLQSSQSAGDHLATTSYNPDSLALIQFSSGATTEPKPVALTHRNLVAQCVALEELLRPAAEINRMGVSWLPLYHDMGLIGSLLGAVTVPGSLVLIPPELFLARPAMWLRAIARHRATVSPAPTFAFSLCARRVKDEDLAGVDLSCWRMALCGAEPISAAVLEKFTARFAPLGFDPRALMPVYGLAEAALAVTFTSTDHTPQVLHVDGSRLARDGEVVPGNRALVSVGTPVPGVELQIRDATGRQLPDRRVGIIYVRGPSVMAGYYDQPRQTATALAGGWLGTGDLGFSDDGELYVCGRAKDVVIIRGANHAPQEFEECLLDISGVRPGCAVALGFEPADADGEALLILAEYASDAVPGRDDDTIEAGITKAVLKGAGIVPHSVRLLAPGSLPRTSSGKMRRREALRRFLAGQLTPPARTGPDRLAMAVAHSSLSFARVKFRI